MNILTACLAFVQAARTFCEAIQKQTMRCLDLFCGGGGAGEGLRAVFDEVVGYDKDDHRESYERNGKRFVQGDVFSLTPEYIRNNFDFVWASPPCQFACTIVTRTQRERHQQRWQEEQGRHINHIPGVRKLLVEAGVPFVIENVQGAKKHLINPKKLCGTQFGLGVYRHRFFECHGFEMEEPPKCDHRGSGIGALAGHVRPMRTEWYANEEVAALRAGDAPPGFEAKEVHFPSHHDRVDHVYLPVTDEMKAQTRAIYKRNFARSIKEALRVSQHLRPLTDEERVLEASRYHRSLRTRLPAGAKQMYPIYGLTKQRGSNEEWSNALGGLPWFTRHELRECIPPAFSKYIAEAFVAHRAAQQ